MDLWASFDTEEKTVITGIYSCEQSTEVLPYQAIVEADDARYATWYNALIACGVTLDGLPKPSQ